MNATAMMAMSPSSSVDLAALLLKEQQQKEIQEIFDWIVFASLIALMLSMGVTITRSSLKQTLRTPKAFIVGFLSQYLVNPLCALTLVYVFGLNKLPALATGVVAMGCVPGGAASNLFAYFAYGDITLSIALTAATNTSSLVFLPLFMWIYTRPFATDLDITLPWFDIVLALIAVLAPAVAGMGIRYWFSDRVCKWVETVGVWVSTIAFVIVAVIAGFFQEANFDYATIEVYGAVGLFTIVGMSAGFGLSRLFRLRGSAQRTIPFEVGVQNGPLALGLSSLTFEDRTLRIQANTFPLMSAGFGIISGAIVAAIVRFIIIPRITPDPTDVVDRKSILHLKTPPGHLEPSRRSTPVHPGTEMLARHSKADQQRRSRQSQRQRRSAGARRSRLSQRRSTRHSGSSAGGEGGGLRSAFSELNARTALSMEAPDRPAPKLSSYGAVPRPTSGQYGRVSAASRPSSAVYGGSRPSSAVYGGAVGARPASGTYSQVPTNDTSRPSSAVFAQQGAPALPQYGHIPGSRP